MMKFSRRAVLDDDIFEEVKLVISTASVMLFLVYFVTSHLLSPDLHVAWLDKKVVSDKSLCQKEESWVSRVFIKK